MARFCVFHAAKCISDPAAACQLAGRVCEDDTKPLEKMVLIDLNIIVRIFYQLFAWMMHGIERNWSFEGCLLP